MSHLIASNFFEVTSYLAKKYRVCHGFRLTKRDDYFRVDLDHF